MLNIKPVHFKIYSKKCVLQPYAKQISVKNEHRLIHKNIAMSLTSSGNTSELNIKLCTYIVTELVKFLRAHNSEKFDNNFLLNARFLSLFH